MAEAQMNVGRDEQPGAENVYLLVTSAPVAVTPRRGTLYDFSVSNPNASIMWLLLYDQVNAAAITVGTTVPVIAFLVTANYTFTFAPDIGRVFGKGIIAAAASTYLGGATANTIVCSFGADPDPVY